MDGVDGMGSVGGEGKAVRNLRQGEIEGSQPARDGGTMDLGIYDSADMFLMCIFRGAKLCDRAGG